jgi:hypothetical protein
MDKYLLFFLDLVLVSIYGYIEYRMGKNKGRAEAYNDCIEQLEQLKKFMEKEK